MSLEQELLAIERNFWTGGPEAYERHADAKCLVVFTEMAGVMPNADIARSAEKGRWRDPVMTPKGCIELADTSAVVTYDCTTSRRDGQPYHAVISSGYVKRPDGWKLAFHQQTPLN